MDIFGVMFLGIVTAFGGGILRDMLLGISPPAVFFYPYGCILSMLTSGIVFLLAYFLFHLYQREERTIDIVNNVFDALGLGAFSVLGSEIAMQSGYGDNFMLVLAMGFITGTGGGIIRDLLVREIPFILKKRIYAIASIIGAASFLVIMICFENDMLADITGIGTTFALRMLATKYKWNLPRADGTDCDNKKL